MVIHWFMQNKFENSIEILHPITFGSYSLHCFFFKKNQFFLFSLFDEVSSTKRWEHPSNLIITHHTRLSQLGQKLTSKPVVGSIVHCSCCPWRPDQVRQSLLAFPRRLGQLHLDAGLIHGNGGQLRYLQHLSTLKLCLRKKMHSSEFWTLSPWNAAVWSN